MSVWTDEQIGAYRRVNEAVQAKSKSIMRETYTRFTPTLITMHPQTYAEIVRNYPAPYLHVKDEDDLYIGSMLAIKDPHLPVGEIQIE